MSDRIATLVEPHIPALRRYAYALTRDHAGADDLVQDTLERVLSRWVLRRDDGDLRAWMFSILHNHFIDGRRGDRRRGSSRIGSTTGSSRQTSRPRASA